MGFGYTTFGGVDITLAIGNTVVGNALGFSLSITREKAPIFVLGAVSAVSFSRGKRGIAGSLVALNTDYDAFKEVKRQPEQTYYKKPTEWDPATNEAPILTADTTLGLDSLNSAWEQRNPFYADQVMPFIISIVGHNETDAVTSAMKVFDCEILNEGMGMALGDSSMESQLTFIARTVQPWATVQDVTSNTAT